MTEVKPEDVKSAMIKNDISIIDIRPCSICNHMLTYKVVADNLFMDTNCNCVTYTTELQPSGFHALSGWLNRVLQDKPLNDEKINHATQLFSSMGLDVNDYT